MLTEAIFGVTADPFTVAHRAIVEEIISQGIADHVTIVPSVVCWHRADKKPWLTGVERIHTIYRIMKNTSTLSCHRWMVDECEIMNFDRIDDEALKEVYQHRRRFIDCLISFIRGKSTCSLLGTERIPKKFKVVIGLDEFNMFKMWTNWEDILKLAKLVVVRRGNLPINPAVADIEHEEISIDPKYDEVSATKIRQQFSNVGDYISSVTGEDRLLYSTAIFDLTQSYVKELDFKPVKIRSNDWVTILVKDGDKFVTVKQLRYGLMKEFVEFPCGMVECDEPPAKAAVRELEEETGIVAADIDKLVYLGKVPTNPAFMTNYMHYFFLDLDEVKRLTVPQHLDEHEKLSVSRHSIDELFSRAYNTDQSEDKSMPALMCTALFLYDNYRKHPSHYKQGEQNERTV